MAEGSSGILQFVPFSSAIEIGFWHKLTKNKLEKYKLDDSSQNLHGLFVNSKTLLSFLAHLIFSPLP